MRRLILSAILLSCVVPATFAQVHKHGDKGPNGGPMQDVAGVHAELLVAERTVTVRIYDEDNNPIAATGFTGSVLVGGGQSRQVVALAAGSDNALTGRAAAVIAKGATITLQLKSPTGKTGQARF